MEYKEILIKKNITHLNGEANILSVFNNFFTEQEAQLKLNNNNIYLFLKEIDIEKVKYFIIHQTG